jgi:hypothetical protein
MTTINSYGGANHTARRKKVRRTGALIVPPNCQRACICAVHTCIHTTGYSDRHCISPIATRVRYTSLCSIPQYCLSNHLRYLLCFERGHYIRLYFPTHSPQFTRDKHGDIRYFLRSGKSLCQWRFKNSPILAPPSDPSCVNNQLRIKESECGVATSRHSCNGHFIHQ